MASCHLGAWFKVRWGSRSSSYEQCFLEEDATRRPHDLEPLRSYVQKAHDDVRQHFATLAGVSLSSVSRPPSIADIYPRECSLTNKKGYFGEIFAALIAESYHPFSIQWEVPAFIFRFHECQIQALQRNLDDGVKVTRVPHRTGDDCVAFVFDDDGKITDVLLCEAKCTAKHDRKLLREAFKQLSRPNTKPVDLLRYVAVLQDKNTVDSHAKAKAIQEYYRGGYKPKRYDLVCYLFGAKPKKRPSWIDPLKPHAAYTAKRPLCAAEVFISGVDAMALGVHK